MAQSTHAGQTPQKRGAVPSTQAVLNFGVLTPSGIAPYVQAIFGDEKSISGQKIALASEHLGVLRDFLITKNPMEAYSRDIKVSAAGAGSVEIKRNIYKDNAWATKSKIGSDTPSEIELETDIKSWHKPQVLVEGMGAADLIAGAPSVLGQRLSTHGTKFTQAAIKDAFVTMVDGVSKEVDLKTPTSGTALTPKEKYLAILKGATKLAKRTERPESMITITLEPTLFDELATVGLIGDRAAQTFTSGRFSVGLMGGYNVQSGSIFLPTATNSKKLGGVIATSDSMVFNERIVAANYVKGYQASNDEVTYLEMQSIGAKPKFTNDEKLVSLIKVA